MTTWDLGRPSEARAYYARATGPTRAGPSRPNDPLVNLFKNEAARVLAQEPP